MSDLPGTVVPHDRQHNHDAIVPVGLAAYVDDGRRGILHHTDSGEAHR